MEFLPFASPSCGSLTACLVTARSSLSTIVLSDVPQHSKMAQTKNVIVLRIETKARKIVRPCSMSNLAVKAIDVAMIEAALAVTVSREQISQSAN